MLRFSCLFLILPKSGGPRPVSLELDGLFVRCFWRIENAQEIHVDGNLIIQLNFLSHANGTVPFGEWFVVVHLLIGQFWPLTQLTKALMYLQIVNQ